MNEAPCLTCKHLKRRKGIFGVIPCAGMRCALHEKDEHYPWGIVGPGFFPTQCFEYEKVDNVVEEASNALYISVAPDGKIESVKSFVSLREVKEELGYKEKVER